MEDILAEMRRHAAGFQPGGAASCSAGSSRLHKSHDHDTKDGKTEVDSRRTTTDGIIVSPVDSRNLNCSNEVHSREVEKIVISPQVQYVVAQAPAVDYSEVFNATALQHELFRDYLEKFRRQIDELLAWDTGVCQDIIAGNFTTEHCMTAVVHDAVDHDAVFDCNAIPVGKASTIEYVEYASHSEDTCSESLDDELLTWYNDHDEQQVIDHFLVNLTAPKVSQDSVPLECSCGGSSTNTKYYSLKVSNRFEHLTDDDEGISGTSSDVIETGMPNHNPMTPVKSKKSLCETTPAKHLNKSKEEASYGKETDANKHEGIGDENDGIMTLVHIRLVIFINVCRILAREIIHTDERGNRTGKIVLQPESYVEKMVNFMNLHVYFRCWVKAVNGAAFTLEEIRKQAHLRDVDFLMNDEVSRLGLAMVKYRFRIPRCPRCKTIYYEDNIGEVFPCSSCLQQEVWDYDEVEDRQDGVIKDFLEYCELCGQSGYKCRTTRCGALESYDDECCSNSYDHGNGSSEEGDLEQYDDYRYA